MDDGTPNHQIDELRALIEQQRALIDAQTERIAALEAATAGRPRAQAHAQAAPAGAPVRSVSRRSLFGLAGAGLAGVAVLGAAEPAAADGATHLHLGTANAASGGTTLNGSNLGSAPAFAVNALDGTSPAVSAAHLGEGPALAVTTSSGGPGVDVSHGGTGAGVRVLVGSTGNAHGLLARIEEPRNGAPVVDAETAGTGNAVRADIDHTTSSAAAVLATTAGLGPALRASVRNVASNAPAIAVNHPGDADAVSSTAPAGTAVRGVSTDGIGVAGESANGAGVIATSGAGDALIATSSSAAGIVGVGGTYGATLGGDRAALRLLPTPGAGAPTSGTHQVGELLVDAGGIIWFCRTAGKPGRWVALNAPSLQLLPAPQRAYDSRHGTHPLSTAPGPKGRITSGTTRIIDLGAATSIPAEATAALCNLTVVGTSAGGYLTLFRNGVPQPPTSSINWDRAGAVVANTAIVACDGSQRIKVFCAGAPSGTDFIIDVVGYMA